MLVGASSMPITSGAWRISIRLREIPLSCAQALIFAFVRPVRRMVTPQLAHCRFAAFQNGKRRVIPAECVCNDFIRPTFSPYVVHFHAVLLMDAFLPQPGGKSFQCRVESDSYLSLFSRTGLSSGGSTPKFAPIG